MKYIIMEKAKPYTRTRRGKLEKVRGYIGRHTHKVGLGGRIEHSGGYHFSTYGEYKTGENVTLGDTVKDSRGFPGRIEKIIVHKDGDAMIVVNYGATTEPHAIRNLTFVRHHPEEVEKLADAAASDERSLQSRESKLEPKVESKKEEKKEPEVKKEPEKTYLEKELERVTKEREEAWAAKEKADKDPKIPEYEKKDLSRKTQSLNRQFYELIDKVEAEKKKAEGKKVGPVVEKITDAINQLLKPRGPGWFPREHERQEPDVKGTPDNFNLTFQADRTGSDGLFKPRPGEEDDDYPDFVGAQKVVDTVRGVVGKDYKISTYHHEKGVFSIDVKKIAKAYVTTIDEFSKARIKGAKDIKKRKRKGERGILHREHEAWLSYNFGRFGDDAIKEYRRQREKGIPASTAVENVANIFRKSGYDDGVSAERKEAPLIPEKKKSALGEGLKSIDDFKSVYDLGKAIYKELQKIDVPKGFGGFAVGYEEPRKSMIISYDLPEELKKPDEYGHPEYELADSRAKYRDIETSVHKVITKLKNIGVKALVSPDSSDAQWIANKPKESEFVKAENDMDREEIFDLQDEVIEKARKKGAKDIKKRKKRYMKELKSNAENRLRGTSGHLSYVSKRTHPEVYKSEVKGFTRVRRGKMERVGPFTRAGQARLIYHAPTTVEKIKDGLVNLLEKITGWRRDKGILSGEQRQYIHRRLKEIKAQAEKKKLTPQHKTTIKNLLRKIKDAVTGKVKREERVRKEREEKRKKGYEAWLAKKRAEKKPKAKPKEEKPKEKKEAKPEAKAKTEADVRKEREEKRKKGYEAWLAKRRAEKKETRDKKKAPFKGLTKQEHSGLRRAGYSESEIKKMGADAAKAAFWNKVAKKEHKKIGSKIAELHRVIGKTKKEE